MCTVCNEKAWPGNAGGACIVCTSADIPAVVKDATKLGRTIPDWCHDRLVDAQKKWRAKTAADKNAKEASNVEAPFGSSRVIHSGTRRALVLDRQRLSRWRRSHRLSCSSRGRLRRFRASRLLTSEEREATNAGLRERYG